jgi:hypothetical protein
MFLANFSRGDGSAPSYVAQTPISVAKPNTVLLLGSSRLGKPICPTLPQRRMDFNGSGLRRLRSKVSNNSVSLQGLRPPAPL